MSRSVELSYTVYEGRAGKVLVIFGMDVTDATLTGIKESIDSLQEMVDEDSSLFGLPYRISLKVFEEEPMGRALDITQEIIIKEFFE